MKAFRVAGIAIVLVLAMVGCTQVTQVQGLGTPIPPAAPSATPSPVIYNPTSPIPAPPSIAPTSPFPTTSPALTTTLPTETNGLVDCGGVVTTTERAVSKTTTTKCYKVQGTSMEAIMGDVARSGPKVDGKDAVATATWQLKSSYTTSADGDTCTLVSPEVTLTVTFLYPDLTTPNSAASGPWGAFMRNEVIPHEERHESIALGGAAKLLTELGKVGSRPTCAQVESAADAVATKVNNQTKAEQNAFDNSQSHV